MDILRNQQIPNGFGTYHVGVAIKLVWAYGIVVSLGGLGLVLYLKWQDSANWPAFVSWLTGMSVAVAFGIRRGREKRRKIEEEEAFRKRATSPGHR